MKWPDKRSRWFPGLLLVGLIGLSGPAQAASLYWAPPSTDLFMNTLSWILGPIVHDATGIGNGTTTPVSVLLGWFNQFVLFFAGFWVAYVIFVGIVKTAHEGQWMGKRWSALWISFRMALAVAMILPVFNGGYSAVQGIMIWLEGNAVGVADNAWSLSAKYIVQDPIGGVVVSPSHVRNLAVGIMTAESCAAAVNYNIRTNALLGVAAFETGNGGGVEQQTRANFAADASADVWNSLSNIADAVGYGQTAHPWATAYTSQVWTLPSMTIASALDAPFADVCGSVTYASGASGNSTHAQIDNAIYRINAQLVPQLASKLNPVAQAIVMGGTPSVPAYDNALDSYANSLVSEGVQEIDAIEQPVEQGFLAKVNGQGFATAGEWWWRMMKLNEVAQNAINNTGTYNTLGGPGELGGLLFDGRYHSSQVRLIHFIMDNGDSYLAPQNTGTAGMGAMHTPGGLSGVATYLDYRIAQSLTWAAKEPRNVNPLVGIQNEGYLLEAAGEEAFSMAIAGDGAKGAAEGSESGITGDVPLVSQVAGAAAKMAKPILNLLQTLAEVLFALGVFLSVWIPLIPFFIWITAIISLLILFVEAVFAAPLWAAFHASPEGHEVVGMGARGWMMLNTVVLTPVLMVIGLMAGTGILYGASWLLDRTIGGAVLSTFVNGSGGFMGLFDAIGEAILYIVLLVVITTMSFGLIHELPAWILAWIGGSGGDRGGKKATQDTHGGGEKTKGNIQQQFRPRRKPSQTGGQ
ncbi:MAG: DotA/TraY family protein [Acidithiobacillus sp.]